MSSRRSPARAANVRIDREHRLDPFTRVKRCGVGLELEVVSARRNFGVLRHVNGRARAAAAQAARCSDRSSSRPAGARAHPRRPWGRHRVSPTGPLREAPAGRRDQGHSTRHRLDGRQRILRRATHDPISASVQLDDPSSVTPSRTRPVGSPSRSSCGHGSGVELSITTRLRLRARCGLGQRSMEYVSP